MGIIVNDNFAINAGKPADSKYMNISTPWTGVTHANANIPPSYRYIGLPVNINKVEYWYKDGIADVDLVVKSLGGTLTGATNGLTIAGANVRLGGILTGTTIFTDNRPLLSNKTGLEYSADYATSFIPRSLVDKGYVDSVASGLHPKETVFVASTSNIIPFPPTGLTTIDGVALLVGNRVLFKDQTNKVNNGIWSANTGQWGRTADFNGIVTTGSYMWVLSGTSNMNTAWVLTTPTPIVGVSGLTFVLFTTVTEVLAGTGIIVSTVTGAHTISFNGTSVAGTGLGWSGTQLYTVDVDPVTGATNGLSYCGKNVVLGGNPLTGNTLIELPYLAKTSLIIGQDYVNWHGGRLEICRDNTSSTTGNSAFLGARYDSTCYSTLGVCTASGITLSSCYTNGINGSSHSVNLGKNALAYNANYHSDYTLHTLVDADYVTGKTSLSILTANNGLNKVGANVRLGGALTGNTSISGAHRLDLGISGNSLSCLSINSAQVNIKSSGATYTDLNPITRTGIQYAYNYASTYTNRSLVDKQYVDNKVLSGTSGTVFTSNIVVSIASGKTFGRYRNLDVIPASGKTANQVILMALAEPLTPTLALSSAGNSISFGLAAKVVNLTFSYTINSIGATITSAKLEYNRGAGWNTLTTTTLTPTGYTDTINDSGNRFNTTAITYRYTVVDSLGGSGYTTHVVTPQAYAAPTISPTYTGTVLSYESQTSREVGNKNTDVAGNITSNRSLVNLTGYTIQRNVNGGGWTTLTGNTFAGVLSKTIVTYNDTSASGSATGILYRIVVYDEYTSTIGSTYTIGLLYASYYGYSTNTSLSSAQIVALGNQGLLTSRVRTMTLTAPVSYYTYVSYPASYGDLTSAIMDGAAPVLGAFTKLTNVVVTNYYSQTVTNIIYKSNATNAFTANSVAFA